MWVATPISLKKTRGSEMKLHVKPLEAVTLKHQKRTASDDDVAIFVVDDQLRLYFPRVWCLCVFVVFQTWVSKDVDVAGK